MCSSARRALETATIVLGRWPTPPRPTLDSRLYDATWRLALALARDLPEAAASALIVGHNPGIGDLASWLTGEGHRAERLRMAAKFPPCGLAVLALRRRQAGRRLRPLGPARAFRHALGSRQRMTGAESRETGELTPSQIVLWITAFAVALAFYFAVVEGPGRINHDMSEAYVWGREFQWGYHQHSPFWAWICGLWFLIAPHEIVWFGVLSAINSAVGLIGVWWATGAFVRGPKRTAALALALIIPGFSLMAFKYNANTIFLSLWPFTLGFFVRSFEGGRPRDAAGFGALAGLCLLSKYYALAPLAACFLASLTADRRAAYWRSLSPYLSVAIALALFAPHLVWLARHPQPLEYLQSRSARPARLRRRGSEHRARRDRNGRAAGGIHGAFRPPSPGRRLAVARCALPEARDPDAGADRADPDRGAAASHVHLRRDVDRHVSAAAAALHRSPRARQ